MFSYHLTAKARAYASALEKGRLEQLSRVQLGGPQQDSGQRFRRWLYYTALAYARASEAVLFGWVKSCEGVVDRVNITSRLTPDRSHLKLASPALPSSFTELRTGSPR